MARSAAFSALLLLVGPALAAGCLAPNDAPEFRPGICLVNATCPQASGEVLAGNFSLYDPPAWEVGDSWTFRTVGPTDNIPSMTLVVVAVGATYEVRPADNRSAQYEAFDDWSFMGQIGRDLSGEQGGQRVRYFDWPLEENKTWSFSVDGRSLRATARLRGETWQVDAMDGNRTYVSYTYDPRAEWFTRIRFGERQDMGLDLTRSGPGYTGPVFTARAEERYAFVTGGPPASTFTVSPGASAVVVQYRYEGAPNFVASARIVDPKGTATTPFPDQPCTAACQDRGTLFLPAHPGAWEVTAASAGTGQLHLQVWETQDQRRSV